MERLPEITTDEQIADKIKELNDISNTILTLIKGWGKLKMKLQLDVSPGCSEAGKSADFIKDCRDKLIDNNIVDLASLLSSVNYMAKILNPENGMRNSEFNKTWFDDNNNKN